MRSSVGGIFRSCGSIKDFCPNEGRYATTNIGHHVSRLAAGRRREVPERFVTNRLYSYIAQNHKRFVVFFVWKSHVASQLCGGQIVDRTNYPERLIYTIRSAVIRCVFWRALISFRVQDPDEIESNDLGGRKLSARPVGLIHRRRERNMN